MLVYVFLKNKWSTQDDGTKELRWHVGSSRSTGHLLSKGMLLIHNDVSGSSVRSK